MGAGYSIRRATPDDKPRIIELVAELFGDQAPDVGRRHEWLYEANPHGRAVTWIAIDDATQEPAACTSFFPRKLLVDGQIVTGALGGDGFVRPKFRRRGIMQSMHARSREAMPELGIQVMFGTPVPANLTPLATAGTTNLTSVARYARPLSAHALHIRRAYRLIRAILAPRSRAYLDPVTVDDPRIDELWARVKPEIGITTVRDAEYFTWRYVRSPSQKQHAFVVLDGGEVLGACALERIGDSMRIIDFVVPKKRWGFALRAIGQHAKGCDSTEIRLTLEGARAHRMLLHGYAKRDPVPRPLNVMLPPGDPRAGIFLDARRWHVTWTESDRDHS